MTAWLVVKNWREHQHYGKRRPPWIKLHRAMLEDYTVASLPDAAKAHLLGIWMLAAAEGGRVPDDAAWIAKRINATTPLDVETLVALGLLTRENDASNALASDASETLSQDRGRVEAETEKEAEEEPPAAAAVADGVRESIPPQYRADYDGMRRASHAPDSFRREVELLLQGRHPKAEGANPADVGQAIRELALKGGSPNALGSFVGNVVKRRTEAGRNQYAKQQVREDAKRKRDENAPKRGGPLRPLNEVLAEVAPNMLPRKTDNAA